MSSLLDNERPGDLRRGRSKRRNLRSVGHSSTKQESRERSRSQGCGRKDPAEEDTTDPHRDLSPVADAEASNGVTPMDALEAPTLTQEDGATLNTLEAQEVTQATSKDPRVILHRVDAKENSKVRHRKPTRVDNGDTSERETCSEDEVQTGHYNQTVQDVYEQTEHEDSSYTEEERAVAVRARQSYSSRGRKATTGACAVKQMRQTKRKERDRSEEIERINAI